MSKIHYFQRYSSPENTVTNNTLQLIARIYNASISKLDEFLADLLDLDEGVSVGIEISQQTKGRDSVPDGVIDQHSFRILLESKVGSGVNVRQLVNHCDAFGKEEIRILVLLTVQPVDPGQLKEINAEIGQKDPFVIFRNVTYQKICEKLEGLFEDYEGDITDIIEDYRTYCRDTRLIDESECLMRVVPTGRSHRLNTQYALYFQPSDRGYSKHAFLGFYREKAVRSIMKIESVFGVQYENGDLRKTHVSGQNTSAFDDRIKRSIADAKVRCGYEIALGHRFFCGSQTFDTDFRKTTPGGIQGARFVNLKTYGVESIADTATIANVLGTQTWK